MAIKKKRKFSPAQLAAQERFAQMAANRARSRPQGGVSRSQRAPLIAQASGPRILAAGPRLHVVTTTCIATAAAAAGSAATAATGDSLTTQNFPNPRIVAAWQTQNTNAGFGQIAFGTGHDTTRGYRVGVRAGPTVNAELILPIGMQLPLTPQEQLLVTLGGNAVAGDVEQMTILTAYDHDQGQKWETWERVRSRMRELTTVVATLTAVSSTYSAGEAINAETDLLLANRDYAWLGCSTRVGIHGVGMIGPDTGNVRLMLPGNIESGEAQNWWPSLIGHCPVINSGNRNSTSLFCHTDENAVDPLVTYYLALLA